MGIERIIELSKSIESALERLGAQGRGLHEKLSSVSKYFDEKTIRTIRKIATIRNKAVHEVGYDILQEDWETIEAEVILILSEIDRIEEKLKSSGDSKTDSFSSSANENEEDLRAKQHAESENCCAEDVGLEFPINIMCPSCKKYLLAYSDKDIQCPKCITKFSFDRTISKVWKYPYVINCPSCNNDIIKYLLSEYVECYSCHYKFAIDVHNLSNKSLTRNRCIESFEELRCVRCGASNSKTNKKCKACKIPLDPIRICPGCNKEVSLGSRVCTCGRMLYSKQQKDSLVNLYGLLNPEKDEGIYYDRNEYLQRQAKLRDEYLQRQLRAQAKIQANSGCCLIIATTVLLSKLIIDVF